jgi:hypothetical protein
MLSSHELDTLTLPAAANDGALQEQYGAERRAARVISPLRGLRLPALALRALIDQYCAPHGKV